MDLIGLLQLLASQLADVQAATAELAAAKYKEGFDAGVLSVVIPVPDTSAIDALTAKVLDLEAQVEQLKLDVSAAKDAAVSELKASLAAKYAELQVVEQAAETGFLDLLK